MIGLTGCVSHFLAGRVCLAWARAGPFRASCPLENLETEISHWRKSATVCVVNIRTASTHLPHPHIQYINTSIHSIHPIHPTIYNRLDRVDRMQSGSVQWSQRCCPQLRAPEESQSLERSGQKHSALNDSRKEDGSTFLVLFVFFHIFFHIFNFSYFSLNLPFLAKWALNSALRTAEPGQIFIFAWRCSAKALDTSSRRATRATLFVAHWHITLCHAETGNWAQRLYMIW